jgi:hypothetical protein
MSSKIERLWISEQELEDTLNLDLGTATAVEVYRAFFCKNPRSLLSVLITEGVVCVLIFVFVMPVSLIANRAAGNLSNTPIESHNFFVLLAAIELFSIVVFNCYLWQQVKPVKSLAKLLEEIEKYNQVISEIAVIATLDPAHDCQPNPGSEREEILLWLQDIRQTLMDALKVENIVRTRQDLSLNRFELLTNLEDNLTALISSDVSNRATQYKHLLDNMLRVHRAVHREIQKLKQRI